MVGRTAGTGMAVRRGEDGLKGTRFLPDRRISCKAIGRPDDAWSRLDSARFQPSLLDVRDRPALIFTVWPITREVAGADHETHLPAQQDPTQADPRVPYPHAHEERTQGTLAPPGQGAPPHCDLIRSRESPAGSSSASNPLEAGPGSKFGGIPADSAERSPQGWRSLHRSGRS
jgi:hypothetical protein